MNRPDAVSAEPAWGKDLLWLIVLIGVLFGFRLGSYPLANPDEGRYAEVPREMVANHNYVTPRLDGVKYFEKPPLFYWCVALSVKAFGTNEWALRAWPALFGLAGCLLAYGAGRRFYGRAAGLAAAAVLATSLLYYALSRLLILDMAVSVLISGALFAFIAGVESPPGPRRRRLFYALYACAALATLTKGLIGFLLPGAVMFAWLLLFNQWKRLRPFYLPTGALLFLLIAAPWHVLASVENHSPVKTSDFAWFYFVHEHLLRYFTNTAKRVQPFWFFAPIVLLGLFPWVSFLFQALRQQLAGGWSARRERAREWFWLVWAAVIFLFFSASSSKLIPYILPVFPPLAVLIGAHLARAWKSDDGIALRTGWRVYAFFCGLIAIAACVAVYQQKPELRAALQPFMYPVAAIEVLSAVLVTWLGLRHGARAGLTGMVVATAVLFGVLTYVTPLAQRPGTKTLALAYKSLARPGDRVFAYHGFFHDFLFYSGHFTGLVDYEDELSFGMHAEKQPGRFLDEMEFRRLWARATPGTVYLLAKRANCRELLADPAFKYRIVAENTANILLANQSASDPVF